MTLDHLDLNVLDLARSDSFYEGLLEKIGYRRFERGVGWCSFMDPSETTYIVLVQTKPQYISAGYHRKRAGVNHLAFAAPDAAAVDDLHDWLVANAVPTLYESPVQMDDRYAVFFEDPDRLKIEYVYRPR